ncbi:MAG: hypothetical protein ACAH95_16950 [Fimbriimonas sp.]
MTSRERVVAAARGGEVDRKPVIGWPGTDGVEGDALIIGPESGRFSDENRLVIAEVVSPFGLNMLQNLNLNKLLEEDPARGNDLLEGLTRQVAVQIQLALENSADGILYRLHGADPRHTSPMQYGGYYLERDRELLEEIKDAVLNIVFVAGGEGVYLDFVSDLPAHVFAWDEAASGIGLQEVRQMRSGALATSNPEADIRLVSPHRDITRYLETHALAAV